MARQNKPAFERVTAPLEKARDRKFSRNLRQALLAKNKSASDIAKEIWGTTTDSQGYKVAKNRDRLSVWLNGKAFPDDANLQKLADALQMPIEELAPESQIRAVNNASANLTIIQTEEYGPNKAFIQFANIVSTRRASEIMLLLATPDEPEDNQP